MARPLLLLVGVGGAIGASVRWGISSFQGSGSTLPIGTLVANVFGAALLGWLVARGVRGKPRALLATGFCGGLTTMSTFSLEVAELLRDDLADRAALYLVLSLVLGVAGYLLGGSLAGYQRPRAGVEQ